MTWRAHGVWGVTNCIDPFWMKLDLLPFIHVEYGDVGYHKVVKMFEETFNKQSIPVKSSLLRKLKGVFNSWQDTIVEPMVKKNNRGRPKKKHVNHMTRVPPRHSCSNIDPKTQLEHMYQEPARHSSYSIDLNEELANFHSFYKDKIPKIFHPHITRIQNVMGDGNSGFRAIAACLGYGEDHWLYIREQLLEELLNAYDDYKRVLTSGFDEIYNSLSFFMSPAPPQHWMVMPETSILIAIKFGVILHYLRNEGCVTCLPMWKGLEHFQHHRTMAIANVGHHYVMVELDGEYPMPCITGYWIHHRASSAVGWQDVYFHRLELYKQLNPCKRGKTLIHIEDD